MATNYTTGNWQARKGDVFNPERTRGIVIPLSREACIEIDGDDLSFGDRTTVLAEVTDGPTDEADARLMAAAPQLFAALERMVEMAEADGWSNFMLNDAYAAIKKATGT